MKLCRNLLWLAAMLTGLAAQAGTITYYHNDIAGSPVVATDATGNVLWRESYRPYGERLTNAPASVDNKVWFTGRRQDVETGLVYMGARYYEPAIGRFISTDPIQFDEKNPHSFNRYAYANNNPYGFVDPDGRSPMLIARQVFVGSGAGYGLGMLADAASQYAAFGSVDWGLTMESTAAKEGATAGAFALLPAGTPMGLSIKSVDSAAKAQTTFKTAHYASRLDRVGLDVAQAEAAVGREVAAMRTNMEVNADVAGRLSLGDKLIEYRARLLDNGTVNVGSIFPVQ